MQRTAIAIAGCLLLACGARDDASPVSGPHASSALTLESHARSAAEVSVCHHAGGRWVPLSLPEAAVKSHVGKHGDFVYYVSAGECCTDADCGAGLACTVALNGDRFIGMCPRASGGTINDPIGFLLALGLFGSANGITPPLDATLIRGSQDTSNQYSLRFTLNGGLAEVPLANWVLKSAEDLSEGSWTPVSVTFPARSAGLTKFDPSTFVSYLNLNIKLYPSDPELLGTGTVNLINASVADFTLEIMDTNPETYPIVFPNSGGSYSILGIRGVYVQPTSYIGDGTGPAGFHVTLPNGAIITNLLVFREAVYDVRL